MNIDTELRIKLIRKLIVWKAPHSTRENAGQVVGFRNGYAIVQDSCGREDVPTTWIVHTR